MKKNSIVKKMSTMNKYQLLTIIAAVIVIIGLLLFNLPKFALGFGIVFAILIIVFSIPQVKGKMGENDVKRILKRILGKKEGYLFNDVIIPGSNGVSSQIDHILVMKTGVYVIETKSYAGRIYGNDSSEKWTQVLAYGKVKNQFYSPVKQNNTHIYNLSRLLGRKDCFFNVVFFLDCGIDYINSEYVYNNRNIKNAFRNDEEILTSDEIEEMYKKIQYYKENKLVSNKEHVKEIKKMQLKVDLNICPRCGKKLVLRVTKDGRQFYGCSGYPNCKFIKNIK